MKTPIRDKRKSKEYNAKEKKPKCNCTGQEMFGSVFCFVDYALIILVIIGSNTLKNSICYSLLSITSKTYVENLGHFPLHNKKLFYMSLARFNSKE